MWHVEDRARHVVEVVVFPLEGCTVAHARTVVALEVVARDPRALGWAARRCATALERAGHRVPVRPRP